MSAQSAPSPPERLFLEDVTDCAFAVGVDRGWWRLASVEWPYAVIEVKAAPRPAARTGALRFQLSGYPEAPSAQPWTPSARACSTRGCGPAEGADPRRV